MHMIFMVINSGTNVNHGETPIRCSDVSEKKYVDEEFTVYWRQQSFLYMLVTSVGEKLYVYL